MTKIRLGSESMPFDIDEFSQKLGETAIKVTVPRDQLPEVLKRALDFINFGIYVYSIVVLPSPTPTLNTFIVQMDRIDFNDKLKGWVPFREGRDPPPQT
ncbi:MAG: hypothetical protein M1144_04075 [Candidatus Thermoplasmatota archaeon]|nr:hypothetical protein [Candidatus Thermoplasmatota archaeon]